MTEQDEYEVSLTNTFEADSPEAAVVEMIEWLQEAASSGFRVTRHYHDEYVGDDLRAPDVWFIDGDDATEIVYRQS